MGASNAMCELGRSASIVLLKAGVSMIGLSSNRMLANNLGQVHTEAGRYSLAQSALEKALEQGSAHDLAHLRGHILLNLASLALRRDDYDQASAILHDALLSAEETQQTYLVTLILGLHARVRRAQGNLAGSMALLQKALGIAHGSGDLAMAETLTAQLHDVERAHGELTGHK